MAITNDKGETLFAVGWHAGMCGTDAIEGVWAKDEDEAIKGCIEQARDWWDSFNSDEEGDVEPELDIWAEEWDDEVHPSNWAGGEKYSNEFV